MLNELKEYKVAYKGRDKNAKLSDGNPNIYCNFVLSAHNSGKLQETEITYLEGLKFAPNNLKFLNVIVIFYV